MARQTAQATQEIERQIEEAQSNTTVAIKSIELVASVIEEVNRLSKSIEHAIEEQSATVNEISHSVSGVHMGTIISDLTWQCTRNIAMCYV